LYVLGLGLACLLVWYQTLNSPFHYDDVHFIEENLSIRKLENCYEHLENFFNRGLLQIGYTLNYAIASKLPDGRPLPESFHAINLLLHLTNTLLAFGLSRLVIRRAYGTTGGTFAASAVALVFAVLPIHTMAVNLIASRAVVQSATFSLLFLILVVLFLDARRPVPQRIGLAAAALVALLCSVASKAVGIAAVGLFGLLAYVIGRRAGKVSFARGQLLYLGIIMVMSGALLVGLIASGAVWQSRFHGVWANLLTQATVTLRYVKLLMWPAGISVEHHVPVVDTLWDPAVMVSMVAAVGLVVIGVWLLLRGSLLGLCILWYFVSLAPSSSLIPRTETMVEYRVYLAALGFAGALVWVVHRLKAWLHNRGQGPGRWGPVVVLSLGALWVIAVSAVTFKQNRIYADPVDLWANGVRNAPQKARPYNNLGLALFNKGRLEEAKDYYREALRIDPRFVYAHNNLGAVLEELGRPGEAVRHYYETLRIKPDFAEAHSNLGNALEELGRPEEAIRHYYEALRIKPHYADAHYNLGRALMLQERFHDAIRHYHEALRINPGLVEVHTNLGNALEKLGRPGEAMRHYYEALRINPDFVEAHYNLGNALMHQGKFGEATRHYYEALRINPDHLGAHYNLGVALALQEDRKGAAFHFSEVLRIDPGNFRARLALEKVTQ
jgi:tetratricopeptide (TPR) repeat protein